MAEERPAAKLSSAHGVVTAFDGDQEEWVEYTEQLENYFIANDIDDGNKKRAILLNGVGPTTYRLIKTLALPGTPRDLSFGEIVERVKVHFNPKPSPIVKRFEFNTRGQKEGESVSEFVAALRKIAEHCGFGDVLSDMLHDRIVCGIRNKRVQQRLLQEAELTYAKARDIAQAAETAKKDAERLQEQKADKPLPVEGEEKAPVNRVHEPKVPRAPKQPKGRGQPWQGKSGECSRCGGKHQASRCKFKEYECHFCKKKGHLAAVCRKKLDGKGGPPKEQTNRVDNNSEDESDEAYTMYRVSSGSSKPLMVRLTINGQQLEMELDTGASVSLMSEEVFQQIGGGVVLRESKAKLLTYTGEPIDVAGCADVQVEHNNQVADLPLIVTKGTGPSLLGRNWLAALKLNWEEILEVKTARTIQGILEDHSELFRDELGTVGGGHSKNLC